MSEIDTKPTVFRWMKFGEALERACQKMIEDGKMTEINRRDLFTQYDKVNFFIFQKKTIKFITFNQKKNESGIN